MFKVLEMLITLIGFCVSKHQRASLYRINVINSKLLNKTNDIIWKKKTTHIPPLMFLLKNKGKMIQIDILMHLSNSGKINPTQGRDRTDSPRDISLNNSSND